MTRAELTDELLQAIKNASDEELRDFIGELFPDSVDDGDASGLSPEFFEALRESVDHVDDDLALDSMQAEALGVDIAATYPLYEIRARHTRLAPGDRQTDWRGSVSAVRVALPAKDGNWKDRRTQIGWVRKADHLVHSCEGLARAYAREFPNVDPPKIDSVELITGARLLAFPRFAPVTLLLASRAGRLAFYAVESADVLGRPKKLFVAEAIGKSMTSSAGYSYTFMARRDNQYRGRLEMDANGAHPKSIDLEIRLHDRSNPHLRLGITFERVSKASPVRWGHFWGAVRRASAIGYPMGYHPNNSFIRNNLKALA
ncbi:MAG TPA: hypothetical protein VK034_09555, partial [Enhygromyxa sp.]|nr:hypothetical protein [Enhygromyxa sp.]